VSSSPKELGFSRRREEEERRRRAET